MTGLSRAWAAWVAYWDEVEHPRSLALVRICLGITLVADFLVISRHHLVPALLGVVEGGGLSNAWNRPQIPLFYDLMPATEASAWVLYGLLLGSALSLTLGWFTRLSALILLFASAQFASVMPAADRGIDSLCRLVLAILVFAPSERWLSVDAWLAHGSVWGDGAPAPSWGRKLLVAQLVLMYFSAGILKSGVSWWPWGGAAALYYALQDPAVAAADFGFARHVPAFQLTQLGTLATLAYQWTYPVVLLLMWWRRNPGRGGWVAALANRWRLELVWIVTGGLFHLILAATMTLGIFPWAMLALYPAWFSGEDWRSAGVTVRNLALGWSASRDRARILASVPDT